MSDSGPVDQIWRDLAALVIENQDSWKRAVVDRLGLPFSRVRILKRLSRAPMTVKELAAAATIDAPATTVAVNDLEARGLVVRQVDPANRRCKRVSLTEAGRSAVREIDAVHDPAPAVLSVLDADDLTELRRILDKMSGAEQDRG
ncbi:MarR family transcriptional regulator [Mycolicibacterium duvalii]|uniref:Transcriptional regulator n=1 Tax=Mycolicibacterium duvalii TaxID=39688 RepID=A0A7I7KA00_9MYCO|nr:MarR family transcriptional regulator [Mycolicibacterium duvalii]MCV7366481.1 MarR family transcriptional regulator [Mycolicibacterium duvalii]PEG43735.1 MarR family transcriptional regulator [Mycolicibacterium duvalii]BBX20308.1 transcriptional regulator [Mycolicibacterium duvalii]